MLEHTPSEKEVKEKVNKIPIACRSESLELVFFWYLSRIRFPSLATILRLECRRRRVVVSSILCSVSSSSWIGSRVAGVCVPEPGLVSTGGGDEGLFMLGPNGNPSGTGIGIIPDKGEIPPSKHAKD